MNNCGLSLRALRFLRYNAMIVQVCGSQMMKFRFKNKKEKLCSSKGEIYDGTLGLNDFVGSMGLTDWGGTFAAITVTVLPVFIFYFFSSKKMLAGMTAGAVKG